MLNTILCATDFSEYFRFTVEWGIWLARRFDARLLVFHAVPSETDILYATDASVTGRRTDEDTEQTKDQLESLMAGCEVDWEPLVVHGDSVEKLIPVVAKRQIDLVVAASYGLRGIKRILLGTVVERMARSLACPLWVVRHARRGHPPTEGIRRIMAACDLSPAARPVLAAAAAMAGAVGARLRLVNAIEAPVNEEVVDPTTGPYEEVQQELENRLHRRLEAFYSGASVPGVPVDTAVLHGHPGEEIPRHARNWEADLIVVGVRRIGRVQRYLRGSTTEALLRSAPCSVLAVPETEAAQASAAEGERGRS